MNTDFPFTHSTNNEYTINHFSIQQFNDSTNQPPNPLTQSWPLPQDRSSPSRGRGLCCKSARPQRVIPKINQTINALLPLPCVRREGDRGDGFCTESHRLTIHPFNHSTNQPFNNSPPNPLTQSWPLLQDRSSPSRGRGLCCKSARPKKSP